PGPGGPDYGERVNVTLRSFPGQEPAVSGRTGQAQPLSFGIDPGMARSIALEEENQALEILLSQGLVACIWHSGQPAGIVSAREKNLKTGFIVPGGTLTLLNTGDVEALARVEAHRLTKLTGVTESLTGVISRDQDYEGLMKKTGTLSFRIEGEQMSRSLSGPVAAALPAALPGAGPASYSLCVAGDSVKALLRGSDGYLYTGTEEIPGKPYRIFPGISGELEVSYGEGLLKVWMARGEEVDSRFIAPAALPAALPASLQSAIDLDEGAGTRGEGTRGEGTRGVGTLESEIQLWSFSLTEPGFVSIGTGERGVTALYGNRDLLRLTASGGSAGREIFHYLGPGTYRIVTRPIRNSEQRGSLYLRKIYPVELESRNQGELRILGPGERHAYRFRVKAAGKVGVGLGVESDLLSTRLFDSDFRLLGEGPLIFKDLPEGAYFLIVQSEHSTVRYRPIVLGLDGSLTDIPQEIIRHYTEEGKP
ncbi:MAG TPA: hypothetical protein VMX75_10275, partial [Spirochaetia bacterium]|nr:hypothetical protein [Spirochaetia bacterium]